MKRSVFAALLITFALSPQAYAENWQPMTGAENLQQLVSGATSEIETLAERRRLYYQEKAA